MTDTKPGVHSDVISTLWPLTNPDGSVLSPSWLKVRIDIRDLGGTYYGATCHVVGIQAVE